MVNQCLIIKLEMKNPMKNQRYLFKFYYIGKQRFFGSQRQNHLLTIERCLINALKEKKLSKMLKILVLNLRAELINTFLLLEQHFQEQIFARAEFRCSSLVARVTFNGSRNRISYLACGFGARLLSRPESLQLFQGGDQFLKEFEFQNHNRRDKNQHDQA